MKPPAIRDILFIVTKKDNSDVSGSRLELKPSLGIIHSVIDSVIQIALSIIIFHPFQFSLNGLSFSR